jgi:flagellar biosynthetic protein FlhB
MSESAEKTEKPTAKRLKDARDKGQVARSKDLALAAASVAATIALARFGERLMRGLGEVMARDLTHFADTPLRTVTEGDLMNLVLDGGKTMALLVGPIAMATMVVGVVTHGFQGGWSFSPQGLTLNWSRLNPANGVKRFGLMQSGMDTLKTMVTVVVLAWLGWGAVDAVMVDSERMPWMAPAEAAATAWAHLESLLWTAAWALGFLSLGDYGLQKYRLLSQLKMTKQEIKDEAKQQEGSAEVKSRIRRIQMDMARRRMMNDVPKATVVITNPTHYAVALEYRRGEMSAPRVLAKGVDQLALKIREKAREHGIPIVENRPLARGLYDTAEIGETIPGPLFAAVAEVLAQLIRLKQLVL